MTRNRVEVLNTKKLLTYAMARLDEKNVHNLVNAGMQQGIDPYQILEEARAGMDMVGKLYDQGKYFLGDLMVAADIYLEILDLVIKTGHIEPVSDLPPIVFGTVVGDIHDIGKNITIGVLKGKGYSVYDLGVDVPEAAFVNAVKSTGSPVLCLSGLITTAYDSMKNTIDLLVKEGIRSQVSVIIGGLVNESIMNYTGADYWVTDCAKGSALCNSIMQNYRRRGAAGF